MKIRHKRTGVVLEGEFEKVTRWESSASFAQPTPIEVTHYQDKTCQDRSDYDTRSWEAVPEWVDVTGGCEWDGNMYLNDRARPLSPIVCDGNLYRLRKVGVEWFSGAPLGLPKWAFIVERKA